MGKAARRKGKENKLSKDPAQLPPPFMVRPFEGLPGETDWVAMREIVPSATAEVSFTADGVEHTATVASILPMAWPGLKRDTGEVLVALQTGGGSGDASRDIAAALLATVALDDGEPLAGAPRVSAATPRLQDILTSTTFTPQVHDTFDFWIPQDQETGSDTSGALEEANESIAPTTKLDAANSAYWCQINDRAFIRWVLPHREDDALDALARLIAADASRLGGNGAEGRLLGAFRACGVLTPVWEVDPTQAPESQNAPMQELAAAFAKALESLGSTPLTAEERRARSGLVSRQITLR